MKTQSDHTAQPTTRAAQRADLIPAIAALTHAHRDQLPGPRIPVLADDTVAYVLARLAETNGTAVLIHTLAGGTQRIVTLTDHPGITGDAA